MDERQGSSNEVIDRLASLDITGGDSHGRLSKICDAIYTPPMGWTVGACEALRTKLMWLIATPSPTHVFSDGSTKPITTDLRAASQMVCRDGLHGDAKEVTFEPEVFNDLCDVIDVVNKHLEAENLTLRTRLEATDDACGDACEHDSVNHPKHYTAGRFEAIDVIEDFLNADLFEGYLTGNVMKYILRYRYKNGLEDLKKARWYLDYLIGRCE